MCGYFGNLHESPAVIDLLNQLGIPLPFPQGQNYPRRHFCGLITKENNHYKLSSAWWWYQLHKHDSQFVVNEKVTSFNARDLAKPLWRNAIRHRRGIVIATELGESQGKNRYLMRSNQGFALGIVYKDWQSDTETTRSMAVITRPAHPRFSLYHEKSTPLFIPLDFDVVDKWLDCTLVENPIVDDLLSHNRITTHLDVTPVKTYKRAEPLGATQRLLADR